MDAQVEVRRLAELMHKDEAELLYLSKLGAEAVMLLRIQFQDALLAEFEPSLSKVGGTVSITPLAISEKICVRYLGATLTGYLSYFTPTKVAAKLAQRFDAEFVTAVAKQQIPERAQALLAALPIDVMRPVTRALLDEQAWPTMGGFVDYLPAEKSRLLMAEVTDAESNLRISSYAQNKTLIASLVADFDEAMLIELLRASLRASDLMREVCLVAAHLPLETLQRLAHLRHQFSQAEQAQLYDYAQDNEFEALLQIYDSSNASA